MAKSLSVHIAQHLKKKASGRAKNRTDFFTVWVDIDQAIKQGWPVKHI